MRNWISKTDKAARDREWNPRPEPIPLRAPGFLRSFQAQGCKILQQYFLGGLSLVIGNTLISQNFGTERFSGIVSFHSNCRPAAVTITKPFAVSAAGSNNDKKYIKNHIILKAGIQPSSFKMTLFLTYPGPVLYRLWLPQIAPASFLARWLVSLQRFFLKKKYHSYHFLSN